MLDNSVKIFPPSLIFHPTFGRKMTYGENIFSPSVIFRPIYSLHTSFSSQPILFIPHFPPSFSARKMKTTHHFPLFPFIFRSENEVVIERESGREISPYFSEVYIRVSWPVRDFLAIWGKLLGKCWIL